MAQGIICRYCGWYESDHMENGVNEEDRTSIKPGYTHTLADCGTYESEDPELEQRLKDEEKSKYGEPRNSY